ncbi:cytochrome b/b6 domain-containing protein [Skermanella stibiiresistens]|uniref:cytochrome b/b6 domain-containing protein n=1 Tax=Skermanella stibiiresistens TaxID=913326 RepID=UPI00056D11B1|nr:cytochrome b/b6 domain-containing protein [Skermanella stibiiresistens]
MNVNDNVGGIRTVTVWDVPVRLFHWTLVAAVATSWATAELGLTRVHFASGYVILILLLFRVTWGVVGSQTARFGDFLKGPAAALRHLRELRAVGPGAHPVLGHNPLGGWMVAALLTVLLVQAGTGLFTSDDILVDGPLVAHVAGSTVKLSSTIHRLLFNLIAVMILIHVGVIVAYLKLRGQNLIRPMVTGVKAVPPGVTVEAPRQASLVWAALVAAMAVGLVFALIKAA